MSAALWVAFATALFLVLNRYIEFRQAVAAIQHCPGFRTVFSAFTDFNEIFMLVPIPGVTIGSFRAWHGKYEDFKHFDRDIISHVSAFPSIWRSFFVADPAAIKEITAQRTRFPKPMWQYAVLRFFGNNIVASEADEWRRFRKITAPAFSEPNNKLVWEETVRIMNGLFDDVWGARERIVSDHAVEITLPLLTITHHALARHQIALLVIGAAGFGRRVTWKQDDVVGPGHSMTFKEALHTVSKDVVAKLLFPEWVLRYSPLKRLRTVSAAFAELEDYMLEMCAARRAVAAEEKAEAEAKAARHDLFSSLLDASDDEADGLGGAGLSDRELLGNIFIFLLAGHETTAHTLCFTFALLAFHPDEQDKLYRHIKRVLSDGRTPTYQDMGLLTQCEAVFYETLRMYPPAVVVPKYAAEDATLTTRTGAGDAVTVPVPRGSGVTINVCALHYNPHYWDEPETFRPDRFLGDWPRDAFVPFSSGARSCLGRRFFETEGIAILTMLIARYRVELKDEPEYAHESMAERKARLMRCRPGLTTT
ncbi:hypothetical protein EIP86_004638 [Pleurotus ostreatoroseus]|nr:hypothetical protein EIP86_004638 [Pleurotus ostreatoroseus]